MPSSRPPQLRRPVIVVVSVVLGVLALLGGPTSLAHAYPYASDTGPTLTLPTEATFVLGQTGTSYLIEAEGDPVPAIGVDKLPAGLRLTTHGDGSATIEGTATGPVGDLTVEVTAQNVSGASYERLTVTVQQAPAFGSRGTGGLRGRRAHHQGHPHRRLPRRRHRPGGRAPRGAHVHRQR